MKKLDDHCVCCGLPFLHNGVQQVRNQSSLYCADPNWFLCTSCKDVEELNMDEAGTNNVPMLVNAYKQTIEELGLVLPV